MILNQFYAPYISAWQRRGKYMSECDNRVGRDEDK